MTFEELKKSRQNQIDSLLKTANRDTNKNYNDDRMWKPTVDKQGNGYAVIRFLPDPKRPDEMPVCYYDHGFQGPTGLWYIEKSRTSLDKADPMMEYNNKLWNSGREQDKQIASNQKRRLHYVSNIYVVNDPANPENNDKVMMFQFGKKIYDKLVGVMEPKYPDDPKINPFDMWETGANFKLKIKFVEVVDRKTGAKVKFRNYDDSEFGKLEPLFEDDDKKQEVYEKLYDTSEFIDPANYKSYNELKARMNRVLCLTDNSEPQSAKDINAVNDPEEAIEPASSTPLPSAEELDVELDNSDEDENIFQSLVDEE